MADLEALMYTYPMITDKEIAISLSKREEFWPEQSKSEPLSKSLAQEDDIFEKQEDRKAEDETVIDDKTSYYIEARKAIQSFVRRFMLVYQTMFLFHSPGAGKTCASSGAAEPLVVEIAKNFIDSYLEPKRTNLRQIVVIVSSEANKRDFIQKIVETCSTRYTRIAKIGASQNLEERLSTYSRALDGTYVFHTRTSFLNSIYGSKSSSDSSDKVEAPPGSLNQYDNSFIIVDEAHGITGEEDTGNDTIDEKPDGDESFSVEDTIKYNRFHYVFHNIKASKILIMTGTPMKSSTSECIRLMNLILPMEKQIPETDDIENEPELLSNYIRGYVSYYRTPGVSVIPRGVMIPLSKQRKLFDNEFEIIFPVTMSPEQVKAYKTVTAAKDPFNRGALRVSNIVYPAGSSSTREFEKLYIQSPRGGMEPNVDFRDYLRTSRAVREQMSPKFCAICDICTTSVGVIFVYMRTLIGGLYDLAAFMEAEGFERYVPRNQIFVKKDDGTTDVLLQPRPRYVIITGEIKSIKGQLENIMELINIPENADGDYIKVVLGSAAVREAFDLKNSVTVIIGTPEQTETAMVQAIGRIVRPGAQNVLLKQHPELPQSVTLYKMASYIPSGENYSGKDVDTYAESARKDRKIKMVERILRSASVDCYVMHNFNYFEGQNVIDYSPQCLYSLCDYSCSDTAIERVEGEKLETHAMDILYQGAKIANVRRILIKELEKRSIIPMKFLEDIAGSSALAQRIVEQMSSSKIRIKDCYSRQSYIHHDRNNIFLSISPHITGLTADSADVSPVSPSEYSNYITLTITSSLESVVGNKGLLLTNMLELIMIKKFGQEPITGTEEGDMDLLKKFSFFIRREIISKSDIMEHIRTRGEQRVKGLTGELVFWVNYASFLYPRGEIRIYDGDKDIYGKIDKTSSGLPLTINEDAQVSEEEVESPGEWYLPSSTMLRLLKNKWRAYMQDIVEPYEKRYKYYGITIPIEPKNLRIAQSGKDNAKTKGKVGSSWKLGELRDVLMDLYGDKTKVDTLLDNPKTTQPKICDLIFTEYLKRNRLLVL